MSATITSLFMKLYNYVVAFIVADCITKLNNAPPMTHFVNCVQIGIPLSKRKYNQESKSAPILFVAMNFINPRLQLLIGLGINIPRKLKKIALEFYARNSNYGNSNVNHLIRFAISHVFIKMFVVLMGCCKTFISTYT